MGTAFLDWALADFSGYVAVDAFTLQGVTTDGSPWYPESRREVCGTVPHQICTFHVVNDIVNVVLSAGTSTCKGVAAQQPKLPKGRPNTNLASLP